MGIPARDPALGARGRELRHPDRAPTCRPRSFLQLGRYSTFCERRKPCRDRVLFSLIGRIAGQRREQFALARAMQIGQGCGAVT